MLVLVFDTASSRCAAALFDGARRIALREEALERGHAERITPMIGEVMAEAGRALSEVELIAACTGPGNFTGARIGVALARGLALSTGARAVGVDRLEALAQATEGGVCVALTARGGALHLARFENGVLSGEAETLRPEEGARFAEGARVIGDGAKTLLAALTGPGVQADAPADQRADASLEAIVRVALMKAASNAPRPAPRYLRPANAALAKPAPRIITA